jgi:hypothetical protein
MYSFSKIKCNKWKYTFLFALLFCLMLVLDGGEWSASCPSNFTPRERAATTHWVGGWVGPRAGLDALKWILSYPCQRSNPSRPACHYTNWAIPASLCNINYLWLSYKKGRSSWNEARTCRSTDDCNTIYFVSTAADWGYIEVYLKRICYSGKSSWVISCVNVEKGSDFSETLSPVSQVDVIIVVFSCCFYTQVPSLTWLIAQEDFTLLSLWKLQIKLLLCSHIFMLWTITLQNYFKCFFFIFGQQMRAYVDISHVLVDHVIEWFLFGPWVVLFYCELTHLHFIHL